MRRCSAFLSPASLPPPETCCTIDQALLLLQKAANLDPCLSFHLLVISLDLSCAQAGEWNLWPWSTFFSFCCRILLVFFLVWGNVLGQILKGHFWSRVSGNLWRESSGQLKNNLHPGVSAALRSPLDLIHQISSPWLLEGMNSEGEMTVGNLSSFLLWSFFFFNDVSYQTVSLPKITPFFSLFWWTNI